MPPIRVRITAAFGAVMIVLLAATAALAYLIIGQALQDEIDTGLRFRAVSAEQLPPATQLPAPNSRLQEPNEAFEQVLAESGRVLRATPGFQRPLLTPAEVGATRTVTFLTRSMPQTGGSARLMVEPLPDGSGMLVVGASTGDRGDALRDLLADLLIGGTLATALACLAGWVVAGWALRPVERMRAQASAITASGIDRRLELPGPHDELHRLAVTLNDMLDRLAGALATERAFFERAGHELRTPLAALRAEVDLALRRERSRPELMAALRSVSQETDRLARLAEDLLVLARAEDGRLSLHREPVSLREALISAVELFDGRAAEVGISLIAHAPDVTVDVDTMRLRQALVNLIDNAMRQTPGGGSIRLTGVVVDGMVRIEVLDTGPGFADLAAGDEPSSEGGLGLRVVRAVAARHGGTVLVRNASPSGAAVELRIPLSGTA